VPAGAGGGVPMGGGGPPPAPPGGGGGAAAPRPPPPPRRLMASSVWEGLPSATRQAAELRAEYPYLSLSELAAVAEPPLTRSALNHRLRRLAALAADLDRRPATCSARCAP